MSISENGYLLSVWILYKMRKILVLCCTADSAPCLTDQTVSPVRRFSEGREEAEQARDHHVDQCLS